MDKTMGFFIVPSDYREESHSAVVPICIADTDSDGNPIRREWIERGVMPVADPLRDVADCFLHDRWRASEITERVVHWLSRRHHGDVPNEPSRRVLNHASWYAADLRAGSRRARRKADVDLFTARLQTFPDHYDLVADLLARDTYDRLMVALDRDGSSDIREMASMLMRDCDADEFERRFRQSRNAISQRFYRGVRRVAEAAGITW